MRPPNGLGQKLSLGEVVCYKSNEYVCNSKISYVRTCINMIVVAYYSTLQTSALKRLTAK